MPVPQKLIKRGEIIDWLMMYNKFLLKEGYADTDLISEHPTAIMRFLKEVVDKKPALKKEIKVDGEKQYITFETWREQTSVEVYNSNFRVFTENKALGGASTRGMTFEQYVEKNIN